MSKLCFACVLLALVLLPQAGFCAEPEVVAATLVALQPPAPDATTRVAELRVDDVKTKGSALQPGQTLQVQLPTTPRLNLGDQVAVKLTCMEGAWAVSEPPVVVGRGEFLNPGKKPTTEVGAPTAKLLVKLFAPFHAPCHNKTRDVLLQFAQAHPEQVRVQIFDLVSSAAREEAERERLTCATVLINNRFTFTLHEPHGDRTVTFQHRPNEPTSLYRSEDVVAALEQELSRLYPPSPSNAPH